MVTLASDRDALLSKLTTFLDVSTRHQLVVEDLLELQEAKSITDRSEWRKLRREARASINDHDHAPVADADNAPHCSESPERFFGEKLQGLGTHLCDGAPGRCCAASVGLRISPKAVSRRQLMSEGHPPMACENTCANVPLQYTTATPSGVLLPSHPCRSIKALTPLKGAIGACRGDKSKGTILRAARPGLYDAMSDTISPFRDGFANVHDAPRGCGDERGGTGQRKSRDALYATSADGGSRPEAPGWNTRAAGGSKDAPGTGEFHCLILSSPEHARRSPGASPGGDASALSPFAGRDQRSDSPPSERKLGRRKAWKVAPSPDIGGGARGGLQKRDSILSADATIPSDNSPAPSLHPSEGSAKAAQALFGGSAQAEPHGAHRTAAELRAELSRAHEEMAAWKERCAVLEAALGGEGEVAAVAKGRSCGGGAMRTPKREQRHAHASGTPGGSDGGWLVQPSEEGLRVGAHFLSSPVTRSLQKTLADEATDIEKVTKALLEGEDDDIGDVGTLLRRISSLKKDITVITDMTALATQESGGRKDDLEAIGKNISIFEEYIGSLHGEVKERMLSDQEELYIEDVREQFDVIDIANDGNCLFSSSMLGLHALRLQEGKTSTGWRGEGAIVGWVGEDWERGQAGAMGRCMSVSEATQAARQLSSQERFQMAADLRAEVVQKVLDEPCMYVEDVATALREAVNSTRMDETSKSLRVEAAKIWGQRDLNDEELTSEQAREVYSRVMSRDGVFGERLEISVVSDCVGRPVHIYYVDSGHERGQQAKPSEVFGAGLAGEPLCLLHMIQGNHFHLMRAKTANEPGNKAGTKSPARKRPPLWRYFLCS